MVLQLFSSSFEGESSETEALLKYFLVVKLYSNLPERLSCLNLPVSILNKIEEDFSRITVELEVNEICDGNSLLASHLRVALGLTISCGAQEIDLESSIPISSAVLAVYRDRKLSALMNYLKSRGWGTWYRMHTNSSYLTEFNEEGWDAFYIRAAELLLQNSDVQGVVGTSWFFDPQLRSISSRLAYLYNRPINAGAYSLAHRSTELDISRATSTSKTRKELYLSGKYTPKSYSIFWPRNSLLEWANN
tara:strand:+ start:9124 stop:9867 length:744 start_codon:yes stop_codon:yes gene_type:complete